MKALEKLRDRNFKPSYHGEPTLELIAAEIETEIKREYMRLPVDADGVPIQIGDSLYSDETKRQFMCRGMSLTLQSDSRKWWTIECWFDGYSGTSEYVSAKSCRHVKPRTLEDILGDYVEAWDSKAITERDAQEITAKYADEIRELMEVGGK